MDEFGNQRGFLKTNATSFSRLGAGVHIMTFRVLFAVALLSIPLIGDRAIESEPPQ